MRLCTDLRFWLFNLLVVTASSQATAAGNVSANYTGNKVTIIGDRSDNRVDVKVVQGVLYVIGQETTVNGQNSVGFLLSTERNENRMDVEINMHGGGDDVRIDNLWVRDLNVTSETAMITESRIDRDLDLHLTVATSGNPPIANIFNSEVRRDTYITGTQVRDWLFIGDCYFGGITIVDMGGGNDDVRLSATETLEFERLYMLLGDGYDRLEVRTKFSTSFIVNHSGFICAGMYWETSAGMFVTHYDSNGEVDLSPTYGFDEF